MRTDSSPTLTASAINITADARIALLIVGPRGLVEQPLLFPEPTIIGRTAPSDVCIDERSISRQHARISLGHGGAIIEDLGSHNGTFVNNERVETGGTPIRIGDALRLGGVVAQIVLRARESPTAELTLAEELDADLASEIERCLRLGKSMALLAGEVDLSGPAVGPRGLMGHMLGALRAGDLVALRSPVRFDALVRGCDKTEASKIAQRLMEALAPVSRSVRIGVAVAPTDAATRERLTAAAMEAMHAVSAGVSITPDMPEIRRMGTRDIVIADAAMLRVFRHAERAAALTMHVLLEGETGVGKEIVAEAIHLLGPRASRVLVKINCAALPENLLESELFGYERGAFSGATAPKSGLVERAHGGTLFLDEIGELPLALQAKLLRFVEDKRLTRLGGSTERFVDVRIVAASHRNLRDEVTAGRFRQDLLFRLSTLKIDIPPIRERKREVLLLVHRFAEEAATAVGRSVPTFTDEALAILQAHSWPGNIREIRNVVTQAIVFCDGDTIDAEHVHSALGGNPISSAPPQAAPVSNPGVISSGAMDPVPPTSAPPMSLGEELSRVERERIIAALQTCGGNQTKAAALLGMPRRTFVSRMAALGIPGRRASKE